MTEPTKAAPERRPMTDAEILAIVNAAPALETAEAEWLHVARAIERHHGIAAAPEQLAPQPLLSDMDRAVLLAPIELAMSDDLLRTLEAGRIAAQKAAPRPDVYAVAAELRKRILAIPRHSFFAFQHGVQKSPDSSGKWIEYDLAADLCEVESIDQIVGSVAALPDARAVIRQLAHACNAMLSHMGMDEDEFNRVTFDQMRGALAAAAPFINGRKG